MNGSARYLGFSVEQKVCRYLKKQGLFLLAKNFRYFGGEIDLIMSANTTIVFIEVRYRDCILFGDPIETVSTNKQKRLIKTALYFLERHQLLGKVFLRFDIVGVTPPNQIVWIKNAFEVECPYLG